MQIPAIEKTIDFIGKRDETLGHHSRIYAAKAVSEKIKGQDGGVVTAILAFALDEKQVDRIVTVKKGKRVWEPETAVVKNSKDLLKTAGTIYSMAVTMEALKE